MELRLGSQTTAEICLKTNSSSGVNKTSRKNAKNQSKVVLR